MFDQSFTESNMEKILRKADFFKYRSILSSEHEKLQIIGNAINVSIKGFPDTLEITESSLRGKRIFGLSNFSDELVVRKASLNIKMLTKVKQQNRDSIVHNLIRFLQEGVPFKIYKLDIKSFYESIDELSILTRLKNDPSISIPTYRVISTLIHRFKKLGINGMPRGLSISATLAEYEMRRFDVTTKNEDNVFFYSRFVDDIIIISSPMVNDNQFNNKLKSFLPDGLYFNEQKIKITDVPVIKIAQSRPQIAEFDYLGYQFIIFQPNSKKSIKAQNYYREVKIDISKKKVNNIKTKIVKAAFTFCTNSDYALFLDRIKFLTGNFSLIDRSVGISRKIGIFYNYRHVSSEGSTSLTELDIFLKKVFLSKKGKIYEKTFSLLSNRQRRRLLTFTFSAGFTKRVRYHFSPNRISQIKACWAYD